MADASELSEEQRKQLEEKLKSMSPKELKQLQKQQCIFCQIIEEKVPSKTVYEDKICMAALDIAPASKGHVLIIPKEHYMIMPQVPDPVLGHIMVIAKRLSQLMLKSLRASGTTVFAANGAVAGQRSQHFFLHLIPRKEGDHVLDFQEKIIPKDLVQKVKASVENRLLELMGVKKPVDETNTEQIGAESGNNVVEREIKKLEKMPTQANQKRTRKKSIKKTLKNSEKSAATENTPIQLDDIANLFK